MAKFLKGRGRGLQDRFYDQPFHAYIRVSGGLVSGEFNLADPDEKDTPVALGAPGKGFEYRILQVKIYSNTGAIIVALKNGQTDTDTSGDEVLDGFQTAIGTGNFTYPNPGLACGENKQIFGRSSATFTGLVSIFGVKVPV